MLEEDAALEQSLFANRRHRSVDHARAARRLRRALSWRLYSRSLGEGLDVLAGFGRLISATPCLVFAALLALAGVVLQLGGVVTAPDRLLTFGGSWLTGISLAYGGLCASLSIRGLVRAAVLAGIGPGIPEAGLHLTAGIVYFDVDCREVHYLPRQSGYRFALSGLLALSTLAAGCALAHLAGGPVVLVHLAAIAGLATFLDLCPFMATDGARLVELSASIDDQHQRVGSYIGRKLLRNLTGSDNDESTRFSIVATLWFVWFFTAVELLATVVADELVPLQIAVIQTGSTLEAWVCGILLGYLLIVCVTTSVIMLWFGFKLLGQAFTRESSARPVTQQLDESDREEVAERLSTLPVLASLTQLALGDVLDSVERQQFDAGAWLRRGDGGKACIYWIVEGRVELLEALPEGGHRLIEELGPGDHFGEETLLGTSRDCRATEACEVIVVDLERVGQRPGQGPDGNDGGRAWVETLLTHARFLEEVDAFLGLDAMARIELASQLAIHHHDSDHLVVKQGDEAQSMFIIRSGHCMVWRGDQAGAAKIDGRGEMLAELGPGDVFGELGLLHNRERGANVSCSEPCVLFELPADALRRVIDRSVCVGSAFESIAAARMEAHA
jgi:CRP-like cAMP-binding protein